MRRPADSLSQLYLPAEFRAFEVRDLLLFLCREVKREVRVRIDQFLNRRPQTWTTMIATTGVADVNQSFFWRGQATSNLSPNFRTWAIRAGSRRRARLHAA